VFRALAEVLGLPGLGFDSAQEVLQHMHANSGGEVPGKVPAERLSNACDVPAALQAVSTEPCVASIYQLDGLVRRAPALQMTADARSTQEVTA
jgi:NADH-quinone oxidoreductase subunit G